MNVKAIEKGDIVKVNFHGVKFTLCKKATVLYAPQQYEQNWVFEDLETNEIHEVSEGCTITLIKKSDDKKQTAGNLVDLPF